MKKTLLLLAASCFAASVDAQYVMPGGSMGPQVGMPAKHVQAKPGSAPAHVANKGTLAADSTRWYWHLSDMQEAGQVPSTLNNFFCHLWYDSTVNVNYSGGAAPVNFASAGQVIDPSSDLENEPLYFGGTTMGIKESDSYRVDSVFIRGAYIKVPTAPTTIVDSLIISVQPQSGYYYWLKNDPDAPWVAPHLDASHDTLKASSILDDDLGNIRRSSHPAARTWAIALTDADRDEDSSGFITISTWMLQIPGGPLNIPAGQNIGVTVAFKSGDVVANPGVDSIDMYHHFRLESFGSTTAAINYSFYTLKDESMSDLMFTTSVPGWWAPAVAIEGWQTNPVSYGFEYHSIAARATCNTCLSLDEIAASGVPEIFVGTVTAYPNPATSTLNVPFTLKSSANVNVTLTNTLGQTVAAQNMGNVNNGKAQFSTANLSNGVYFYTVDANGQKTTGRFVVAN